eukprot:12181512-Alexandrium_andersonii.AAC.1
MSASLVGSEMCIRDRSSSASTCPCVLSGPLRNRGCKGSNKEGQPRVPAVSCTGPPGPPLLPEGATAPSGPRP